MTRRARTLALAVLVGGCTTHERAATQGAPGVDTRATHASREDRGATAQDAAASDARSGIRGHGPRLSGGGNYACLRAARGAVVCWDLEFSASQWQPCPWPTCPSGRGPPGVVVEGLPAAAVDLSVSDWGACAVVEDGSLWCWRHPRHGGGPPRASRVAVGAATSVTCTRHVVFAIGSDGFVWAWGVSPSEGEPPGDFALQLRPADDPRLDQPGRMPLSRGVRQVAGDEWHACALAADGAVACWGTSHYGSVGDVPDGPVAAPHAVPGLSHVVALGTGANGGFGERSCALIEDGSVVSWGAVHFHVPGLREASVWPTPGESTRLIVPWSPTPVAVPGIAHAVALSSDYGFDCVIDDQRVARCWGEFRPLATAPEALPVSPVSEVTAWGPCVLDGAGAVTCVGKNVEGWGGLRLQLP